MSEVLESLIITNPFSLYHIQKGFGKTEWKIGLIAEYKEGIPTAHSYEILEKGRALSTIDVSKLSKRIEHVELIPISSETIHQVRGRYDLQDLLIEHDISAIVLLYQISQDKDVYTIGSFTFWTGNSFLVEHVVRCNGTQSEVLESKIIEDDIIE